jgi:hypothetical protein
VELWIGCVAGALGENEFLGLLRDAGFENPSIEVTRVYAAADAATFLEAAGLDADTIGPEVDGKFVSAFVRATKPVQPTAGPSERAKSGCCGPDCCSPAAA